jgi:hypothetical protein
MLKQKKPLPGSHWQYNVCASRDSQTTQDKVTWQSNPPALIKSPSAAVGFQSNTAVPQPVAHAATPVNGTVLDTPGTACLLHPDRHPPLSVFTIHIVGLGPVPTSQVHCWAGSVGSHGTSGSGAHPDALVIVGHAPLTHSPAALPPTPRLEVVGMLVPVRMLPPRALPTPPGGVCVMSPLLLTPPVNVKAWSGSVREHATFPVPLVPFTQSGCRGGVTAGQGTTATAVLRVWPSDSTRCGAMVASAVWRAARCDRLGSLGSVSEWMLLPSP